MMRQASNGKEREIQRSAAGEGRKAGREQQTPTARKGSEEEGGEDHTLGEEHGASSQLVPLGPAEVHRGPIERTLVLPAAAATSTAVRATMTPTARRRWPMVVVVVRWRWRPRRICTRRLSLIDDSSSRSRLLLIHDSLRGGLLSVDDVGLRLASVVYRLLRLSCVVDLLRLAVGH